MFNANIDKVKCDKKCQCLNKSAISDSIKIIFNKHSNKKVHRDKQVQSFHRKKLIGVDYLISSVNIQQSIY